MEIEIRETEEIRIRTERETLERNNELAETKAKLIKEEKERAEKEKLAKAAREKAAAEAAAASKKAYEVQMAARREKDAAQAERHRLYLKSKKEAFEAQFKLVWGSSETGISVARMTVFKQSEGETMINGVLRKTLIADGHHTVDVIRKYKKSLIGNPRSNIVTEYKHQLFMITSDERVAELIEETVDISKEEQTDILIFQMTAASKEYIAWAVNQTEPVDDSNQYTDVDPFANSTAIGDQAVSVMKNYQTK